MKHSKKKRIVTTVVVIAVIAVLFGISLIKGTHKVYALTRPASEAGSQDAGTPAVHGVSIQVNAADFAGDGQIAQENVPQGSDGPVVYLTAGDSLSFNVDVQQAGSYKIRAEYAVSEASNTDCLLGLLQEGEFPGTDAQNIVLPQLLEVADYPFSRDKSGDEIVPEVTVSSSWQTQNFRTLSQKTTDYLLFDLQEGTNHLELKVNQGSIYLSKLYIESPEEVPAYEEYAASLPENTGGDTLITIEAERMDYKNSTTPRPTEMRDVECYPYESNTYLMSAVGGETWQDNSDALYYEFNVEQEGWYYLALKAKQSEAKAANDTASSSSANNTYIHRSITIDGEIPFAEAGSMVIPSTSEWAVTVLGNDGGYYPIYLTEGTHVLGIEVDSTMLLPVADAVRELNDQVNDMALEIRKLIGNNSDVYRDWEIESYIPGISDTLNSIADGLEEQAAILTEINMGEDKNKELTSLKICAQQLRNLAADPDSIPNNMTMLSEGTGSVSQTLGELTEGLVSQPLSLDQIYLAQTDAKLPEFKENLMTKFVEGTKYFLSSFEDESTGDSGEETKEITVWVNRARNYIDLLQKMTDAQFTEETGIKVNFSIMPNEQKLILANTTNTQPDVALGVSIHLPYDLAIRGSVYDLRQFDDFNEVAANFAPGAFITHTYEDGIYALPETQDFYVMFYRSDLLESLGIPVPDTWDDVVEILPELQRYGMNFYAPLSLNSSFKTFSTTLPFIYQKGATIYSEDGMTVALNSEEGLDAIKFMTDLYTIYGIPSQVGDFYQSFRSGDLPIGVSNFATYLKLDAAAAELSGKWDIAPMPGFVNEDGEVARWSTGGGQTSVIFSKSDMIEESWEFLKWWSSTETQIEFGEQMKLLYGDEYIWNTANLEAFSQMPIPEEHKQVILDQWEWLYEFPKTPASYMVEREISNIWNEIVFDGDNARSALDDGVILMNQELARKMEEFGYIQDGVVVKEYTVPTVEQIESWVGSDE
ncbi:MAG TPA: extracellular solute-binding protein [Candidatus Scybalocola faecigallinarum]|uniref:Extracellular solute-binding protein n=1 Tax=Candidatus Scybalocola faecigallinarum TaxID=2840941 RepID=A0A9D1F4U6_9FIRM|nr:extracellular solute-binding protein [Candidatus Scybalocola faecigallinarum]